MYLFIYMNLFIYLFIHLLYTPYISRGFYFREFRESGAIREFINTRKYLPPIPTHECDLCTQYIALLDREFNHSRKCLKVPIREKLDSRNIWRIQYSCINLFVCLCSARWLMRWKTRWNKEGEWWIITAVSSSRSAGLILSTSFAPTTQSSSTDSNKGMSKWALYFILQRTENTSHLLR